MQNKKGRRALVVALSIALFPTAILPNRTIFAVEIANYNVDNAYYVDFQDGNTHGWKKLSGTGNVTFSSDGMEIQQGGSAATYISADNVPDFKDGYMEAVIRTKNENYGRFGFHFRFEPSTNKTPKNAAAFNYDFPGSSNETWRWGAWNNGNETWAGSKPDLFNLDNTSLKANKDYKLRVELVERHVVAYVTDLETGIMTKLVDTQGPSDWPVSIGKFAIRTWGFTDNYANLTVKNLKIGEINQVNVQPSTVDVAYEDVGNEDVEFTLSSTDNSLKHVIVNGSDLEEGKDFTLKADKLILKKEYLLQCGDQPSTTLTLQFEDGYSTSIQITIRDIPEQQVSYTRNFNMDGMEGISALSGTASIVGGKLNISNTGRIIDTLAPATSNATVTAVMTPNNDATGDFGIYLRYVNDGDYVYVGTPRPGTEWGTVWQVKTPKGTIDLLGNTPDGASRVFANRVPYTISVRLIGSVVTLYVDGIELAQKDISNIITSSVQRGTIGVKTDNRGASIQQLHVETAIQETMVSDEIQQAEIQSERLHVNVDATFPRVINYAYHGQVIDGQVVPYHIVEVNNVAYVPEVTSDIQDGKAIYHMKAGEYTFDTILEVNDETLKLSFDQVGEDIYNINFPKHSLVSMKEGTLTYQKYLNANHTSVNLSSKKSQNAFDETSIAVMNNKQVAVALFHDSLKGNREVAMQTQSSAQGNTTGIWANEFQFRSILDDELLIENPCVTVKFGDDVNQDGEVSYQDAAILYREITPAPVGYDVVNDAYSTIAMNVGSGAQYPFLRILDNAKKVYLGTDGFQQNILIKGYQNQGHDSSHPDFADINKGAGGVTEFQTLLREAKNYNTTIGVHINHTETYPEAPQYETMKSDVNGWVWYDQAKQIIRENDILDTSQQGLYARIDDLANISEGNLSMVYVDVYSDRDYPAHRLMSKLNSYGWAVGGEYQGYFSKQCVWIHNPTTNAGGYADGSLIRFADHQYKEEFRNSNLFRGQNDDTRVITLNGWQMGASSSDGNELGATYNKMIRHFYESVLPNKYVMQFPVMRVTSNQAILGDNYEVTTEYTGGKNIIKKDGNIIADGMNIFIPWDVQSEEKIYVYSKAGGTLQWDLPTSWNDVRDAKLYALSDQGRGEENIITVNNHNVTLNLVAGTGYVLYKGNMVPENVPDSSFEAMNWGDGSPVKDMGFDSYSFDAWTRDETSDMDSIHFVKDAVRFSNGTSKGNTTLKIAAGKQGSVTQNMKNLVPGEMYTASVWVDVPTGRKATLTIGNGSENLQVYSDVNQGKYGLAHTDKLDTSFQRLKVTFQAQSEHASIQLAADNHNNGAVYFDDVRIMKSGTLDKQGHSFYEDFENVDQGYGIFEAYYTGRSLKFDNSHLSNSNPVTPESTDDVIDGNYSLKITADSGDGQGGKTWIQTMPDRVRLLPNTTYALGFDYLAYNMNGNVTIKVTSKKLDNSVLNQTFNGTGKKAFTFTTGESDDYYIELIQTGARPNCGYVIDNLYLDVDDQMEPSTISNIQVSNVTSTSATLQWTAASDDTGIAHYELYCNNERVATTTATSYPLINLTPESYYVYEIYAVDMAGKRSAATSINVTTDSTSVTFAQTLLQKIINKTDGFVSDGKLNKLAPSVSAMIRIRLNEAKMTLAKEAATNEMYLEAWLNLANALQYMDFMADKNVLKTLIDTCDSIDLDAYITGVEEFKDALLEAEKVYLDDGVLQDTIDSAYHNLSLALKGLMKEDVNKVVLQAIVTQIMNMIGDGSKYKQDATWDNFQNALQTAKGVLNDANATQEMVNNAFIELTNCYCNIRLLPDEALLSQLQNFIDMIRQVDLNMYIETNRNRIVRVRSLVSQALADPDNLTEEVYAKLQPEMEAVLAIVINEIMATPIEDHTQIAVPVDRNSASASNTTLGGRSNPGTTKTGDATSVAGLATIVLTSAIALFGIKKKRKKNI